MTFKIQEYNQLKEKYKHTKIAYLAPFKASSIEVLEPERREAMRLIEYVIDELDKSIDLSAEKNGKLPPIKKAPNQSPPNPAELLTAAIHLVSADIHAWSSALQNRLDNDLGIAENNPSDVVLYHLYRQLNQFFRAYFVNKDSRNGIAPNNPFRFIDTANFIKYLKKGHEQEELYFKNFIMSLDAAGKEVSPQTYRVKEPILLQPLSKLPPFDTLNESLTVLELEEQGLKKVAKTEEIKNPKRVAQVLFLNKLRESLKVAQIKDTDKIAILAGAMYIVREQISRESMFYEPLSNADNNSVIHTGLTERLNAKTNTPENIHDLVKAALSYMTYLTLDGTEQIRSRHIFSDLPPAFSLTETLLLSKNMIKVCRIKALDTASAAYAAALEEQKSKDKAKVKEEVPASVFSGLLDRVGGFFSSISTPAPVDADQQLGVEKEAGYESTVAQQGPGS